MDSTGLLKNAMFIGLGLLGGDLSSSSNTIIFEHSTEIPMVYKINDNGIMTTSSTRSNISDKKFSLEKLKMNKRRLLSFLQLSSNWNGYEGEALSKPVIDKTISIITKLDFQPEIFPTGRNSIQIENEINENNFYEIEISTDNIFIYLVKNGDEVEKEMEADEVIALVNSMYV